GYIDTLLFASYDENDLRRELFFRDFDSNRRLLGTYTGINLGFGGIATDELYLNRSESKVRLGDINGGMQDLNDLMITRWATGTFTPFQAQNETDALTIILEERRKQLIHRGTRWPDIKRLNLDSRFALTLSRFVN